jgi:hypothetical protein
VLKLVNLAPSFLDLQKRQNQLGGAPSPCARLPVKAAMKQSASCLNQCRAACTSINRYGFCVPAELFEASQCESSRH